MDEESEALFRAFSKAYMRADREAMRECTTDDFDWHQHDGGGAPTGNVIAGVDAVCTEIEQRKRDWRDVKYEDFCNVAGEGLITSAFRVSGVDEAGHRFDVRAVDLYAIRDGRIARKDSYWKQPGGA